VNQKALAVSAEMGVGIGLRRPHFSALFESTRRVDWLELISENFMSYGGRSRAVARQAAARWPVVTHGVGLNLGSTDAVPEEYFTKLKTLVEELNSPWFSDHLCFSSYGGHCFHDLLPLPRTEETVDHVVSRIQRARAFIGRPFALENVSAYVESANWPLSDTEFYSQIVQRSECLMLLDINNIYVNSLNHGWDCDQYLRQLPLNRVVQVHLAGHSAKGALAIDTHGAPVCEPVWALYRRFLELAGRKVATLIEWDNNLPEFDRVLAEADRARAIVDEVFA
jgi:uncharacterized protein